MRLLETLSVAMSDYRKPFQPIAVCILFRVFRQGTHRVQMPAEQIQGRVPERRIL